MQGTALHVLKAEGKGEGRGTKGETKKAARAERRIQFLLLSAAKCSSMSLLSCNIRFV